MRPGGSGAGYVSAASPGGSGRAGLQDAAGSGGEGAAAARSAPMPGYASPGDGPAALMHCPMALAHSAFADPCAEQVLGTRNSQKSSQLWFSSRVTPHHATLMQG